MTVEYDDEIDLLEYAKIIWKYKYFIVAITLLSIFVTFFTTKRIPPKYKSTVSTIIPAGESKGSSLAGVLGGMGLASLVAGDSSTDIISQVMGSRRMTGDIVSVLNLREHYGLGFISAETFKAQVNSKQKRLDLISDLKNNNIINKSNRLINTNKIMDIKNDFHFTNKYNNMNEIANILNRINIGSELGAISTLIKNTDIESSGLFKVTVEDKNPEMAAIIANTYIEHLDIINEELKITTQKPMLQILDKAIPPLSPSNNKMRLNLIIATVLSSFITMFISFFVEYIINIINENKKTTLK
jgi:capsular polysaccharide biosynthesis protein